MKEIEIVIPAEKLENLEQILLDNGARGMMIGNVLGFGRQKGRRQVYTREEDQIALIVPKMSVRTVVEDTAVEQIIDTVVRDLNTGNFGSGKIFVKDVETVVKIRTGERDHEAL